MAAAQVAVFREEPRRVSGLNGMQIMANEPTSNPSEPIASTSRRAKTSNPPNANGNDEPSARRNSVAGITPLMLACQQGQHDEVQKILQKKKSLVKDKTRNGKTALHFCAESGSSACIDLILTSDPDQKNVQDEEGYSPLHLAVINGNKDVVRVLISSGADLNCLDNEKHSLVHWATVCGEVDILELLLSSGAPASTPDIHLAHPIHYAAQMCGTTNGGGRVSRADRVQSTVYGVSPKKGLQILKRLIQFGCPVDVRDQDGRQPLLWAASAGSADAILLLVNAGAKVDAEDRDGLTALHCAACRGNTDCLETLISLCGAEVDVIDNNGCTALFYAVTMGHADCTELLLNYGAEPNRQDRKGRTPAHCGASKGQLETLKLLGKHGGNLWMRNVRGDLPLHEAVLSKRKDLVVWLLSQRPEAINTPNNDGKTFIHLAALNNNVEMVKILIDHSADVNVLMRSGKGTAMTPLDAAMHKGNSGVAKFITLHGGLASNSLNDAALHRRLNRSVEGQISPASSFRGSQLGSNHYPSPDQRTSVSPDVFDHSLSRNGYSKTGSQPPFASTPIMDDAVQTDSTYLKDREVQVSDSLEEGSKQSSNGLRRSERRKKKRSKSRKISEAGSSSNNSSLDRSSSHRQKAGVRRHSKVIQGDRAKAEDEIIEAKKSNDRPGISPQASTETLPDQDNTLISEKFSELENVEVQSSETDAREEDLGAPERGKHVELSERKLKFQKEVQTTSKSVNKDKPKRDRSASASSSRAKASQNGALRRSASAHPRSPAQERKTKEPKGQLKTTAPRSRSVTEEKANKDSKAKTRNRSKSAGSRKSKKENQVYDEIEAGNRIDLQEAARRRSESLARDPLRRSRSISVPRHNCTDEPSGKVKDKTKSKKHATTSEEREVQLQDALLASSTKLRTDKSTVKSKRPITPRYKQGRKSTTKATRKSSAGMKKVKTTVNEVAHDSGFSDHRVVTSTSEELKTRLTPLGKPYVNVKRKVVTRRPGSGNQPQRKSIFSSTPKQLRGPKIRDRYDTMYVQQMSFGKEVLDDETTSSTRGSLTSEDIHNDHPSPRRGAGIPRARSKLTFSRNDMAYERSSPRPKRDVDVATPISVTQAMQASMRKYNLERMIFHELLELKRLQLRAGKAVNEQLVVRRLAENYKRAGYSVSFRDFEGPFTFRDFEVYLYGQLRMLQQHRKVLPHFAPSDDIEKLSVALRKMSNSKLPYLQDAERSESVADSIQCSHTTHRCHHAAHAYTGVPCAAYIGSRKGNGFLPRVNPIKAPGPMQKDTKTNDNLQSPMMISITPRTNTQSPIKLEVQQGSNTQVFSLPTESLDPSKNYYVSLSIKPNHGSRTPSHMASQNGGPSDVVNDGSISAPPPPIQSNGDIHTNLDRDKHNRST